MYEDKNPWRKLEENDKKNLLWPLDWSNRERTCFEKGLNSEEHVRNKGFRKLSTQFSIDRKLDSIDRKSLSIDPTTIETYRAKPKL